MHRWPFFAFLAAASLSSACGGAPAPRPLPVTQASEELVLPRRTSHEGHAYARLVLRFIGIEHAPARELVRDMLVTHGLVDQATVDRDGLVILGWYMDHGRIEARVTNEVTADRAADRVTVTFRVHEGEIFRVRALDVYEALDGKRAPALGWVPKLRPGDIFRRMELITSLDAVRTTYHDLGYAYADVVPKIVTDSAAHQVSIEVPVARGPLTFIERVRIAGHHATSEATIRGELLFKEGDRYSDKALLDSKQRLLDTEWFESIALSMTDGSAVGKVVISVEVTERPASKLPKVAGRATPTIAHPRADGS
ncbi:MAG: hypothetical protein HYV09_14000 [Deltaproteobacteria bacterium]|nr:hypothetical protein [Deltaproteobacteria bacterium]